MLAQVLERRSRALVNRETALQDATMNVHRNGKFVAFTGQNAERRAYRAGQFYRAAVHGRTDAIRYCYDYGIALTKATPKA